MHPNPTGSDRSYWFPAKRFGWGWGLPITWQGWVVLTSWVVVVTVGGSILAGRYWLGFGAFMLVMTATFIGVCYAKGEPPRWRWGD